MSAQVGEDGSRSGISSGPTGASVDEVPALARCPHDEGIALSDAERDDGEVSGAIQAFPADEDHDRHDGQAKAAPDLVPCTQNQCPGQAGIRESQPGERRVSQELRGSGERQGQGDDSREGL
ncbi:hypothetical protein D3C78_1516500 [compost metagenome]